MLIVNASPVIFLGNAGHLNLLQAIDCKVIIAQSAFNEVTKSAHADRAKASVLEATWLARKSCDVVPSSIQAWDLGAGESEVLGLGLQFPEACMVLDDLAARRCALAHGLTVIGTVGVLVKAHRLGHLANPLQTLDELRQCGMWLADSVVRQFREAIALVKVDR
jgi:predicted nucleic acid-binding protein